MSEVATKATVKAKSTAAKTPAGNPAGARPAAPTPAPGEKESTQGAPKTDDQSKFDEKMRGAGSSLVALLDTIGDESPHPSVASKIAQKLADGTATNAELATLRDALNALAAGLRQQKKRDTARRVSDLNRGVRRAERATRGQP